MNSALILLAGLPILLAIAIALELTARFWKSQQGYFVWRRWDRTRMLLSSGHLPFHDPVVQIEINADGERGDELPEDKTGLYRVLVAGGSATECSLLDQEATWPAVLQRELSRPERLAVLGARRVHVGNIGRSLTPVAKIQRFLERTWHRYDRLDLLIAMVGASDVLSWLEGPGSGKAGTQHQPPDWENQFAESPRVRYDLRKGTLAIRAVAVTAWRRYLRPVRRVPDFGPKLGELRRRRNQASCANELAADPSAMLDGLDQGVRSLIEWSRGRAGRIVLLRQPWFDREPSPAEAELMWNFACGKAWDLKSIDPQRQYYSHRKVHELMELANERVIQVAANMGVEVVDLREAVPAGMANFYDELHFTPEGARRLAETVAAALTGSTHGLRHLAAAVGAGAGPSAFSNSTPQTAIME